MKDFKEIIMTDIIIKISQNYSEQIKILIKNLKGCEICGTSSNNLIHLKVSNHLIKLFQSLDIESFIILKQIGGINFEK